MSLQVIKEVFSEAAPSRSLESRLEALLNALTVVEAPAELLRRDLFAAAVVVLILENGFAIRSADENDDLDEFSQLRRLPQYWKRFDGSYEWNIALKRFPAHSVRIVITSFGDDMLVNAILSNINNDVYSKCIPAGQFVIESQNKVADMYENLSQFALNLKTNIISPVSSRVMRHHGYQSASLVGLPMEVLIEMFMFLKAVDIINTSLTCLDMGWIRSDNVLWRALLQRDYPAAFVAHSLNYLNIYKEEHSKSNEIKIRTRNSSRSLQRSQDMNWLDMNFEHIFY